MSQKTDIWMPLYVADYLADTAYLTTEQSGAYLFLLMAYWRNGPPPDNDAILASITRLSPDAWGIARAVLQAFFDVSDGRWLHNRVEQELDKAKRNRDFAHERAVKGAKARWENASRMLEAKPEAMLEHMLEQCTSPSPSPSPTSLQSTASNQKGADAPVAGAPKKSPKGKQVEWVSSSHMIATCEGLTEPVAVGYLEFRRSKNAALTELAWKSIVSEVIKTGMAPDAALSYAMNRGWRGFDSKWLINDRGSGKQSRHDLAGMDYTKGVDKDGNF